MPNFPSPGIAWSSHISFWSRGNKPRNMSWSIPFLSIFLCLLLFHFNFFRLVWFWIYLKDSSHSFFHLISPCLRFLPADPFFSVGRNNLEQVHWMKKESRFNYHRTSHADNSMACNLNWPTSLFHSDWLGGDDRLRFWLDTLPNDNKLVGPFKAHATQ